MPERFRLKPVPAPKESVEQCQLVRWLDYRKVLFTHCPSGEMRSPIIGAKLRRMGVRKGIPDILIFSPVPCGHGVGVALELKRVGSGKPTVEQLYWLAKLRDFGWKTNVCHGAKEAIEWLMGLGY